MELYILEKFLISIMLGAILGIEREKAQEETKEKKAAGVRTFALISLAGTILAHLSEAYSYLILVGVGVISLLIIAAYIKTGKEWYGITTEVGSIIALFLGILCYTETFLAVILTIFVSIILAVRKKAHSLVRKIKEIEMIDTLKFALISLVVLPFLPNRAIDPFSVINPFRIWLLVVFISGMSFFGYFLIRVFGAKSGIEMTGILGGLASSTAVTSTMSSHSKNYPHVLFPALFAATLANSIMFIRVLIEVSVVKISLVYYLIFPMLFMMLTGLLVSIYFWNKKVSSKLDIKLRDPFTLTPALKFALFFVAVLIISKFASIYWGETGVYATSILSGLADVDSVTLSMATLAGKEVSTRVAINAIILAAISNTIAKTAIASIFGSKEFRNWMLLSSVCMITVGLSILIIMF